MTSHAPISVLIVNASGRKNGSVSRRLASDIVSGLRNRGLELHVTTRDLADGMPFVDEAWIGANFTPPQERSAEQAARLSFSDSLVDELQAADLVIIASPVYNFSIPAALKAWVDQIARARLTFKYTEAGPVGLLTGKRAVIALASGGTQASSPVDFATSYLRHILGFIGIDDVSIIAADKLMLGEADALAKAEQEIEGFASALALARAA